MAAGVQLAEMRGSTRQYTYDRGLHKSQKIQQAKLAVAKAGAIWSRVKAQHNIHDPTDWPWLYTAQRDFDNAVERLKKLTGDDDE